MPEARGAVRLETSRLALKVAGEADFEGALALLGDAEVMRFVGSGKPLARDEAQAWLAERELGRQGAGLGCFAVMERATAGLIGLGGLERLPLSEHVEVFYLFGRSHWGMGYATEAAGALVRYGLEGCGLERVGASFDPENEASIRVARKVGMRFERHGFDEHGLFTVFYVLERR